MRYPIAVTRNPVLRPLLALLGVRSASSWVNLDEAGVTVRMGRWFEEAIPLSEIAAFGPSTWPRWGGYGVKLAPRKGIGVVASTKGVVHIALRQPRRMSVVIMSRSAERLWVSLEEREAFLAELSRLTGLPVSAPVGFWRD
jgi:hypothetical protein